MRDNITAVGKDIQQASYHVAASTAALRERLARCEAALNVTLEICEDGDTGADFGRVVNAMNCAKDAISGGTKALDDLRKQDREELAAAVAHVNDLRIIIKEACEEFGLTIHVCGGKYDHDQGMKSLDEHDAAFRSEISVLTANAAAAQATLLAIQKEIDNVLDYDSPTVFHDISRLTSCVTHAALDSYVATATAEKDAEIARLKSELEGSSSCSSFMGMPIKEAAAIIRNAAAKDLEIARLEKSEETAISERDHWEDVLTNCAIAAGCNEEWSNLHEHGDCIVNEIARLKKDIQIAKDIDASYELPGPCGHKQKHYESTDGGKHITCPLCELNEELIAMTMDRNLWRDGHNDDCPNVAEVERLKQELEQDKAATTNILDIHKELVEQAKATARRETLLEAISVQCAHCAAGHPVNQDYPDSHLVGSQLWPCDAVKIRKLLADTPGEKGASTSVCPGCGVYTDLHNNPRGQHVRGCAEKGGE